MEVDEEFEPAPEEMEGVGGPDAGRTECFFSFALSFVSLFWRGGGGGVGEPHLHCWILRLRFFCL